MEKLREMSGEEQPAVRKHAGQVSNIRAKYVQMAETIGLGLPTDDEIDQMRLGKVCRLLRELGLTEDETEEMETKEAREELKKRIRDIRATASTRRLPGQALENLRVILDTHNSKRARLAELCHRIAAYLRNLDKGTKDNLKTQFGREVEDTLTDVQTQLHREECPILVAGETSSGKSTFLNLLLGEDILPVAHLNSTSTICEVKYGETRQAVVHLREANEQGQRQITIPLDGTKRHQQHLKHYMHVEGASRDNLPPAERVEIFWPHPLLQGGIVLVDSPGVGETDKMDDLVADYIPKAFALLYIIDSSRAGGVQQDRLGRLLQLYARKDDCEDFNPESAMFICNKWDWVPPDLQEEVKSETLRKLSAMWPGLEESQVFFVSMRKAVGLGGILSEDFTEVLDGLDLLLPKSLDIKLDTQYRLLTRILSAALTPIDSVINAARKSLDKEAKVEMFIEAQKYLQSFDEELNRGMEQLNSMLCSKMKSTMDILSSLVKSGKLTKELNAGLSWYPLVFKFWYSNNLATLRNKKKLNGEKKLKDLYAALADELAHCPSFKDHITSAERSFEQAIKGVVESLEVAYRQTMHVCNSHTSAPINDLNVLFHTSSLWEHCVALLRGLSPPSLSSRLERLGKSMVKAILGSQSKTESILTIHWEEAPEGTPLVDILISALSSSDELLTDLAERQMQPLRDLMALLEADITKMRTTMEQTIDQTFKDARSNEEILQTYRPQSENIDRFLSQLAMFHLTEMRKYEYDLDSITGWTDTRNRLGGGSFGEVFRVQVPWKGAETPAALKLGLMPYHIITTETARDFLKEEKSLRTLQGKHIVEYYGTACRREGGNLRLGLVMELCDGTMADRIIGQKERNPAWWGSNPWKQAAAFSYTQNLAVQLCEGLKQIHDAGYIHRDLKLRSVLVTEDDTVKLADVGLTKQEDKITGTIAGTPLYTAPEVLEGKVYDKSADIYSLGLILWEMWYGVPLYGLQDDIYSKRIEEDLRKGCDIRMPRWPDAVPPTREWTRLIHDCLKKEPKERPKIQDCLDRISPYLPTDEEIDQMKLGKLTRLLREEFGMTEDETDDMEKEEARAELKERIRQAQAAATRRRAGQASSPEEGYSSDEGFSFPIWNPSDRGSQLAKTDYAGRRQQKPLTTQDIKLKQITSVQIHGNVHIDTRHEIHRHSEGWTDWNGTLATLTVEHLQCFKDSETIHLHPKTTGIIGPNSSGKTTLIRAWLLFAKLSYKMSSTSSGTQLISNSVITDTFALSDIIDFWYRGNTEKPVTISGRDTDGNWLHFTINYVVGGTLVRVDKMAIEKVVESESRFVASHRPVLAVVNNVNSDAYKSQVPVNVPVPAFPVVRLDHTQVFSMLCELQQDKGYWSLLKVMLEHVRPGCAIRLISGARQRGQKVIMVREGALDIPLQICDSGLLQIVAVLVFVLHSVKRFCPYKPFSSASGDEPIATVLLDNIHVVSLFGCGISSSLSKCLAHTIKCQTVVTTLSVEIAQECEKMVFVQCPNSSHHPGNPPSLVWDGVESLNPVAHPVIAYTIHNLGATYEGLGDHRKAIRYYERSLKMRQSIYGGDTPHPDIVSSLFNLGATWRNLGDHQKAIRYFTQSLQMMKRDERNTACLDIAVVLDNLGAASVNLGDLDSALNYHEESQMMKQSIYGSALGSAVSFQLPATEIPLPSTDVFQQVVKKYYELKLTHFKPLIWNDNFTLTHSDIFTELELILTHKKQVKGPKEGLKPLDDLFNQDVTGLSSVPSCILIGKPGSGKTKAARDAVSQKTESGERKELKSLDDLFKPDVTGLSTGPRCILIEGEPGIGKTTFLSKEALDAVSQKTELGRRHDIVLLIRLREVREGDTIEEMVWDQCVPERKDLNVKYIEAILERNESRVLFLLDGYDELLPEARTPMQAIPKLLSGKMYPNSTIVITSRPSAGVQQYTRPDCHVHIMGFSRRHVEKFVWQYFSITGNPGLAEKVLKVLSVRPLVTDLIQTPMYLMFVCLLWEEDPDMISIGTMSGLYHILLTCLVRKLCERERVDMPTEGLPTEVAESLLQLGKLALEALLRNETLLDLTEAKREKVNWELLLKLGVVSLEVSSSKLHPRKQLNFSHKTMQEFLAGQYVAHAQVKQDIVELLQLTSMSKALELNNLLQFTCGCDSRATQAVMEELSKLSIREFAHLQPEQFQRSDEPLNRDVQKSCNTYTRFAELCLNILSERQEPEVLQGISQALPIVMLDSSINSREATGLKYYIQNLHTANLPDRLILKIHGGTDSRDTVQYLQQCFTTSLPGLKLDLKLPTQFNSPDLTARLVSVLKNVPRLRALGLSHTYLTPSSLQPLVQGFRHVFLLEELDLSENSDLGDAGMEVLQVGLSRVPHLAVLHLGFVCMTAVGMSSLAPYMHHLVGLRVLDISWNEIGDTGLESLTTVLHTFTAMQVLGLRWTGISPTGMRTLVPALCKLTRLIKLDLSNNDIGDPGLECLAAILHHLTAMKVLVLRWTDISDRGITSLNKALPHLVQLRVLDVSFNNIGDSGIVSLVQTLCQPSSLDMEQNPPGDKSLTTAPHYNTTLQQLDIGYNRGVTGAGLGRVAQLISTLQALTSLNMSGNLSTPTHLSDTAAMDLAEALPRLPALERLDLERISMEPAGFQAVVQAAEEHPRLERLQYTRWGVPEGADTTASCLKLLYKGV